MTKLLLPFLSLLLLLQACRKDTDCPPGFTGADCSAELVPRQMRITRIELLDWPLARPDNGAPFDRSPDAPLPDIAIAVFRDSVPVWNWPFFYENAEPGQPLVFTPLTPIYMDAPLARYAVAVWDWDAGETAWDVLGAVAFTPYEPGKQFPDQIEVQCAGCAVRLRLSVAYVW